MHLRSFALAPQRRRAPGALRSTLAATGLLAVLAGCGERQPARAGAPQGRALYEAHCAACHGTKLEGQPDWRRRRPDGRLPAPPHDDSGHTWHHPREMLFQITKYGVKPPLAPPGYPSDMPGFGDRLSDAQIHAVLDYIESTWSPEVRQARAQMLAAQGAR